LNHWDESITAGDANLVAADIQMFKICIQITGQLMTGRNVMVTLSLKISADNVDIGGTNTILDGL